MSTSLLPSKPFLLRTKRFTAALTLVGASLFLSVSDSGRAESEIALPDFGSSARAQVTPEQERAYAQGLLRLMRNYNVLVDDPLVEEYVATMANRLVQHSDRPNAEFTFVVLRDPAINAFAAPGGLIAMHTGLILAAENESEVAAVMAHEIAHVTQNHILRAMENTRLASLPILLATLGAAIAARGQGDATPAAIMSGMALIQQQQINFTRANEFEADRIGIQTLKRAGYNPAAMATFFLRLQQATRSTLEQPSEFLRTHPVTTTRIAEAKARAEARRDGQAPRAPVESPRFALIRERIRVLESQDPPALLTYYAGRLERQGASTALHYGQTLAQIRARQFDAARRGAAELLAAQPDELCFKLLRAEVEVAAGQTARWQADYRALIAQYPRHRVVSHLYAQALLDLGSEAEAVEARELLRALAAQYGEDPAWHELLGRAHRLAGDRIRAGESYARAFALRGAYDDALRQLQDLARQPDLDFYQRARIDAQIAELTPRVLAMRREGFAGGTEGPRSSWRAPEADRPSGG